MGTEEDSSDHGSSDDDDEELAEAGGGDDGGHRKNVWNITKEQLNYYTTQFFSMQENPAGVIPGNQAKEFFEKSNLPIAELRKIWQLSDVTMDGCLSLEEFLTAMHLVVLRRNNITLPDSLPTCLRPTFLKSKLEHSLKKQVKKDQLKETNLVILTTCFARNLSAADIDSVTQSLIIGYPEFFLSNCILGLSHLFVFFRLVVAGTTRTSTRPQGLPRRQATRG